MSLMNKVNDWIQLQVPEPTQNADFMAVILVKNQQNMILSNPKITLQSKLLNAKVGDIILLKNIVINNNRILMNMDSQPTILYSILDTLNYSLPFAMHDRVLELVRWAIEQPIIKFELMRINT